jgi:quinolinate synthase
MVSLSRSLPTYSEDLISAETDRLLASLMHIECSSDRRWNWDTCHQIAPLTLAINTEKKRRGAVILAHSYVEPEIIYGVADYRGDSYQLSRDAAASKASMIVFAGVVFMAETAKILSPEATVVIPDRGSGCSLADALNGEQLRALKAQHPNAAVVCYINSTAEVKAESDVCVTSTNVFDIVQSLAEREILFVPDRLMAANVRDELGRRGVDKVIHTNDGTCMVHDQFRVEQIRAARLRYPGLEVISHPECTREVAAESDFVGSTGAMMRRVRESNAPYFMMLTECGLVSRLEVENPGKNFIGSCKMCPYMKKNALENIWQALTEPTPRQVIDLDETLRLAALRPIERMFEITESLRASGVGGHS